MGVEHFCFGLILRIHVALCISKTRGWRFLCLKGLPTNLEKRGVPKDAITGDMVFAAHGKKEKDINILVSDIHMSQKLGGIPEYRLDTDSRSD